GDVCELRLVGWLVGAEAAYQTLAEVFAGVQQAFKGDGTRGRTVVEEHGDGTAFVEFDEVGTGGIDRGVRGFGPGRCICAGTVRAGRWWLVQRPHACALVRSKDGEANDFLGHEVEDLARDGGLGEPHALRCAAEAVLEVGD